jgi:hypothetical protein
MSVDRGFIALYRGFFDHPMFKAEPFTEREAFVWMLMEAAHDGRRVRRGRAVIELSRGQLCHSIRFMAVAWKWRSSSRVVRFLKRLENETAIEIKTEQEATQITICNYNKYQGRRDTKRNADETQSETLPERSRNARGTLAEQTITTKPLEPLFGEASPPAKPTKERRSRRAAEIPLPPSESLPVAYEEHARSQGVVGAAAEREWRKFRDHAEQKDRRCAGERGWLAAWRGWITKAIEFNPPIVTQPVAGPVSRETRERTWRSCLVARREGRPWPSQQVKLADIPQDFIAQFELEHPLQERQQA